MITIIQQKYRHGWCYCLSQSDGEPIDHAYVIGFSRPNYPMPATQGSVSITKYAVYIGNPQGFDCVACWRHDRGQVI